jgi:hypothetical protein
MFITYPFTQPTYDPATPTGLDGDTGKNMGFSFNIADCTFQVSARPTDAVFEVPAKLLKDGNKMRAGFTIPSQVGALGPHEDHLLCRGTSELTYTTRVEMSGGVLEKIMAAGAQVGDYGRMNLYKGCTLATFDQWTERITREFEIVAADIANRRTGWPTSGTAPTIDTTSRSVTGGGDGYMHI